MQETREGRKGISCYRPLRTASGRVRVRGSQGHSHRAIKQGMDEIDKLGRTSTGPLMVNILLPGRRKHSHPGTLTRGSPRKKLTK